MLVLLVGVALVLAFDWLVSFSWSEGGGRVVVLVASSSDVALAAAVDPVVGGCTIAIVGKDATW